MPNYRRASLLLVIEDHLVVIGTLQARKGLRYANRTYEILAFNEHPAYLAR